jgi:hypothetical protein
MTDIQIDWPALRDADGPPPWTAIDAAIVATVAHPETWRQLADAFWESLEGDQQGRYLCVYLPVILAEAAAAMSTAVPQRTQIANFLLDELHNAEDDVDDFLCEIMDYSCGRLGPWIVPLVFQRLESLANGYSVGLWGLMNLIDQNPDPALRAHVASQCVEFVEAAARPQGDLFHLLGPVHVLTKLRHTAILPFLDQLMREKTRALKQRGCWGELREAADELRGIPVERYPETWDTEMRTFIEEKCQQWQVWEGPPGDLADDDDDDDDDDYDDSDEALEERADDLAQRFAESSQAAALPAELQRQAQGDVAMMVRYGLQYLGGEVGKWRHRDWEELLLEILPRKVTTESQWWPTVAPIAGAFLRWLGDTGIAPHAQALAPEVEQWGPEIDAAANDPRNWGMAKSFMMQAIADGVEPGNEEQLQAFTRRYNARLPANLPPPGQDAKSPPSEPSWTPPQPYTREEPKIGRNDPCPCGSGKKYKKCCGK